MEDPLREPVFFHLALSLETLPKVLMTRQGWVLLGTGRGLVRKGLWGAVPRIHRAQ